MEEMTFRKTKTPVASILLWIKVAFNIVGGIISSIQSKTFGFSTYTIIFIVMYIVMSVFSLKKKQLPLFFSVAAYVLFLAFDTIRSIVSSSVLTPIDFILSIVYLIEYLLFLFVIGSQALTALSSLKNLGKKLIIVPPLLCLLCCASSYV